MNDISELKIGMSLAEFVPCPFCGKKPVVESIMPIFSQAGIYKLVFIHRCPISHAAHSFEFTYDPTPGPVIMEARKKELFNYWRGVVQRIEAGRKSKKNCTR